MPSSNPTYKPPVPARPTESNRPPRPAGYPARNANRPPIPQRPTSVPFRPLRPASPPSRLPSFSARSVTPPPRPAKPPVASLETESVISNSPSIQQAENTKQSIFQKINSGVGQLGSKVASGFTSARDRIKASLVSDTKLFGELKNDVFKTNQDKAHSLQNLKQYKEDYLQNNVQDKKQLNNLKATRKEIAKEETWKDLIKDSAVQAREKLSKVPGATVEAIRNAPEVRRQFFTRIRNIGKNKKPAPVSNDTAQ